MEVAEDIRWELLAERTAGYRCVGGALPSCAVTASGSVLLSPSRWLCARLALRVLPPSRAGVVETEAWVYAHMRRGRSGDDMTNVCRDASMSCMRRKIAGKTPEQIRALSSSEVADPVTQEDLEGAITRISPSVSKVRATLSPLPALRSTAHHVELCHPLCETDAVWVCRRTARSTRSGWQSSAPRERRQ